MPTILMFPPFYEYLPALHRPLPRIAAMLPPTAVSAVWLVDRPETEPLTYIAFLLLIVALLAPAQFLLVAWLTPTVPHLSRTPPVERWSPRRLLTYGLARWRNPIQPNSVAKQIEILEHAYGLDLVSVWPLVALVAPADARKESEQAERSLAAATIGAASGATTMLVAAFLLEEGAQTNAGQAILELSCFLGLWLTVVLVAKLGRFYTALYAQRARLLTLYRFRVYETLHLPSPVDSADERERIAPMANQWRSGVRELEYGGRGDAEAVARQEYDRTPLDLVRTDFRAELSGLREDLERQTRRLQQDLARSQSHELDLGDDDFDRLADKVGEGIESAIRKQVGAELGRLKPELLEVAQKSIEVSIDGPSLTDFSGALFVDLVGGGTLQRASEAIGSRAVFRLAPGDRVKLLVGLSADYRARDLLTYDDKSDNSLILLEPVVVTGGERNATVRFEVVLDSATLSVQPRRKMLHLDTITGSDAFTTLVEVPREPEAKHEMWLQLYEKGRLIQASTLIIDTRAQN